MDRGEHRPCRQARSAVPKPRRFQPPRKARRSRALQRLRHLNPWFTIPASFPGHVRTVLRRRISIRSLLAPCQPFHQVPRGITEKIDQPENPYTLAAPTHPLAHSGSPEYIPAMRLLWLALFLALFFLALALPFVLRENDPALLLSEAGARSLLDQAGRWAWLAALALLLSDLLLPVPATAVMSALGYLYGAALGGAIGAAGSIASGLTTYGLCRALGPRAAEKLVGKKDLARGQLLFQRAGGWVVALSRWLPVLSEVVACLAGLTRMPFPRFAIAVACGNVPMAFAFAAVGSAGIEHPAFALGLSAAAPILLWGTAAFLLHRHERRECREKEAP